MDLNIVNTYVNEAKIVLTLKAIKHNFLKSLHINMPFYRYISLFTINSFIVMYRQVFLYMAQNCPPNIDFENGSFTGWICYTGTVASVDSAKQITFNYSGGPVFNRHTMYSVKPWCWVG